MKWKCLLYVSLTFVKMPSSTNKARKANTYLFLHSLQQLSIWRNSVGARGPSWIQKERTESMKVIHLSLTLNHFLACWLARSERGKFHRYHFDQPAVVDKKRPYMKLLLSKQVLI